MSASPKLVLDEDVVRFALSLPAPHRRRLLNVLEHLRQNQAEGRDFVETDHSGRRLNVKVLRPFQVTYWIDGPVDELRVVDAELVRA